MHVTVRLHVQGSICVAVNGTNNLLYVKLDDFNQNIFIFSALIIAQPEFNVISGRLGKLSAEPWWGVEAAASAL